MSRTKACRIARKNLEAQVSPVLAKYRQYIEHLRPGSYRDIYPWHTPEDVAMEAACRLEQEGWRVRRIRYTGSAANYPGSYFLRVTAPLCPRSVWRRWLHRTFAGLENLIVPGCG